MQHGGPPVQPEFRSLALPGEVWFQKQDSGSSLQRLWLVPEQSAMQVSFQMDSILGCGIILHPDSFLDGCLLLLFLCGYLHHPSSTSK